MWHNNIYASSDKLPVTTRTCNDNMHSISEGRWIERLYTVGGVRGGTEEGGNTRACIHASTHTHAPTDSTFVREYHPFEGLYLVVGF